MNSDKTNEQELPRIAIAGLAIESSTFSPARTHEAAFHPKTGDEIFGDYPFLAEESPDRKRAHWVRTLKDRSLPVGMVTKEAYESRPSPPEGCGLPPVSGPPFPTSTNTEPSSSSATRSSDCSETGIKAEIGCAILCT